MGARRGRTLDCPSIAGLNVKKAASPSRVLPHDGVNRVRGVSEWKATNEE